MIKNIPNIINKNFKQEFPFQFFKLSMIDNKFIINFQHNDSYNICNKRIIEYSNQINNLVSFSKLDDDIITKDFIFKELLVAIFKNNKSFKNLKFNNDNIIQVEEIYNMGYIKPLENLEKGPILITQRKNGEVFDFGFVIKENNVDIFFGIHSALNRTDEDITKYINKIKEKEEKIIKDISILTKREVSQIRFIIILNKESQEEMKKDYDNTYSKMKNLKEDIIKMNQYEKINYYTMKKKIKLFRSNSGIVCCENNSISYMLFSIKDLKFYINNNIIENFNPLEINPIKSSFELFCCLQYKLIPIKKEDPILAEEDIINLINQIKSDNPRIKSFKKIKYKLPIDLPFSMGTPQNTGILTILKEIKIFTYFYQNTFIHYTFEKSCINKYYEEKFLFKNNYDFESAKRYFIFLIETPNFENKNEDNEEIIYKNKIKFIQKKRKK